MHRCVSCAGSVSLSVCTLTVFCGWVLGNGAVRSRKVQSPVHVVLPASLLVCLQHIVELVPTYFYSRLGGILHGTLLLEDSVPKILENVRFDIKRTSFIDIC